ncbi:hypothetical protein CPK_ORF00095 [Chlamydia pneumoniae LPCoLN]|uniref:Uncharacterized protein n=1 Tax=Chlamydia pneumoniae TaxID=83558 RepID=A0A0F7WIJ3_CHLPN|nr:hypothetical protein CPK_ORF00095 [Chlamydia pneumoniae LPCoLN]ETR80613.1 hypothetical protein X556_0058 [Chlamydia pneumoniae B21]CRI33211.1 Uncharacterized protein BN1224_Wien1_A_07180 [Chlamydia pneumoniae]CRI36074.1 Uncharacterized protein BN1224_CM1_A_07210 [Chlamydia pneumoniae]CRI37201.1 Uncharacterized protein BN1224_CV14_A_07200 [Chlamydia pneumoniae]
MKDEPTPFKPRRKEKEFSKNPNSLGDHTISMEYTKALTCKAILGK